MSAHKKKPVSEDMHADDDYSDDADDSSSDDAAEINEVRSPRIKTNAEQKIISFFFRKFKSISRAGIPLLRISMASNSCCASCS